MTDTSLMVTNTRLAIMPVMDNTTAMMRRQAIIDFTRAVMRPDVDYGRVPGTRKDTLLKPGAEKLTSLFGLSPRFDIAEKETDWTGKDHGGEPFFYFQYRCSLYYGDVLAGQGVGSCNSWEKKYRYRNAERVCPDCGKATIFKSKPRPNDPPGKPMGYYCWNKTGGCGAQFGPGDVRIESQEAGQVPNDNPADLVNTVDKMAQKRALVAAVLIAVNASEFFTQDIEDMDFGQEVIDVTPQPGKKITVTTPPANGKPATVAAAPEMTWDELANNQSPRDIAIRDGKQFVPMMAKQEGKTEGEIKDVAKLLGMSAISKKEDERGKQWDTIVDYIYLTRNEKLPHDLALAVINDAITLDEARKQVAKQPALIEPEADPVTATAYPE